MSRPSRDPKARVHFVTLGCPKNRVDSELMLGQLQDAALGFADDPADADVIVVNTCGFIEDAKKESIDVILEMARYKSEGLAKKLIVTGCLVQRYASELAAEIPEIDALLGNGEYGTLAQVAKDAAFGDSERLTKVETPTFIHEATSPRVNTFLPHSAYVKVSEGCDQKCSFCIIPKLRGLQRSRSVDDIVQEVEALAARGVVEVNLVAQDLTAYGLDLSPRSNLAALLRALARTEIRWIRMHYAYPRPFSKALLAAIAEEEKVLPYLDMPLQHISDPVLKRMQRGRPRRFIEKLLEELRAARPGLFLRTSFIVGFPGETDRDFAELCDFVKAEDFANVGVFKFSREEGTPSHDMPDQVPRPVVDERHEALMGILQAKSRARLKKLKNKKLIVLVDGPSEESELLLASRHAGQAPEIDGVTYINDGMAEIGALVEVKITETHDYDLVGKLLRVVRPAPARPSHPRLEAKAPSSRLRVIQAG